MQLRPEKGSGVKIEAECPATSLTTDLIVDIRNRAVNTMNDILE